MNKKGFVVEFAIGAFIGVAILAILTPMLSGFMSDFIVNNPDTSLTTETKTVASLVPSIIWIIFCGGLASIVFRKVRGEA